MVVRFLVSFTGALCFVAYPHDIQTQRAFSFDHLVAQSPIARAYKNAAKAYYSIVRHKDNPALSLQFFMKEYMYLRMALKEARCIVRQDLFNFVVVHQKLHEAIQGNAHAECILSALACNHHLLMQLIADCLRDDNG